MENENKFTETEKIVMLKMVLDEDNLKSVLHSKKKINDYFEMNLANIIIATGGKQF